MKNSKVFLSLLVSVSMVVISNAAVAGSNSGGSTHSGSGGGGRSSGSSGSSRSYSGSGTSNNVHRNAEIRTPVHHDSPSQRSNSRSTTTAPTQRSGNSNPTPTSRSNATAPSQNYTKSNPQVSKNQYGETRKYTDGKGRDVKEHTDTKGVTTREVQHKDGRGKETSVRDASGKVTRTSERKNSDGSVSRTKQYENNRGQKVTEKANGDKVTHFKNGGSYTKQANGGSVRRDAQGNKVVRDASGRVQSRETRTTVNGRTVVNRTTVINNRTYVNSYHGYGYGGGFYHAYTPFFYYNSFFYGFMLGSVMSGGGYGYGYNPWMTNPYYYPWGPLGYSYYYTPYPYYTSPTFWLTDYILIHSIMANSVSNQVAANTAAVGAGTSNLQVGQSIVCTKSFWGFSTTCTKVAAPNNVAQAAVNQNTAVASAVPAKVARIDDGLKTEIKGQVDMAVAAHSKKEPITLENAKIVIAHESHNALITNAAADASDEEKKCEVLEGDVLKVGQSKDGISNMLVMSSRNGSCSAGSMIMLSTEDAQAMLNNFSEKVDSGLKAAQEKKIGPVQGAGAMPVQALQAAQVTAQETAEDTSKDLGEEEAVTQ